jgi:hypothetical protein
MFVAARVNWVLAGAATLLLSACGGSAFEPAMMPADVCALLTQADAQTILPTAGPGAGQVNAQTNDYWSIECAWLDSSSSGPGPKYVSLIVAGALTSDGSSQLDDALTTSPNPTIVQAVAVSGLGDKAAYLNDPGNEQVLRARLGNYLADLRATSITPDVTELQLHPLVAKAIAGL